MFDSLTHRSTHKPFAARWTTVLVSGALHVAAVIALVIPALYMTGNLPEPKEAMAVFLAAPAPPPPPPPAPAAAPPAATPKSVARVTPRVVAAPQPVAAAPVEAPVTIAPETGHEGMPTQGTIAAGFERGVDGGIVGGVVGGLDAMLPPPPPAIVAPVRVGGAVTAPRLRHRVEPVFPEIAARAVIQGIVILEATVGRDGVVDDVKVLRSHRLLDEAAIAAVEQWIYEPLMLNGLPQPFILTVTLSFNAS